MPVYDYACAECGPFTVMRPMAECDAPHPCPGCGGTAARAWLTAPRLGAMSSARRAAFAANERSADSPFVASAADRAHRAGCTCCASPSAGSGKSGNGGAKGFPSRRPWMISH